MKRKRFGSKALYDNQWRFTVLIILWAVYQMVAWMRDEPISIYMWLITGTLFVLDNLADRITIAILESKDKGEQDDGNTNNL